MEKPFEQKVDIITGGSGWMLLLFFNNSKEQNELKDFTNRTVCSYKKKAEEARIIPSFNFTPQNQPQNESSNSERATKR